VPVSHSVYAVISANIYPAIVVAIREKSIVREVIVLALASKDEIFYHPINRDAPLQPHSVRVLRKVKQGM
jgi:hypothetical protein